ncbi:MAG: PAS domain-containing protein [Acidimicrobiales bacterium]
MAERCRSFDWSSTSLGPADSWSRSLRTAVGICLTSRFPMLVVWGPDLVKIYNDGYRPILGEEKHPAALGAPAAEVWHEIWDVIEPMFRQVLETGTPTWSEHELLVLERNGFPEECYFTWSYSPLPDDDGRIAGVLDVVSETTDEVVSRRRMALLATVGAALLQAGDPADLCLRARAAISAGAPDLPAVDLHLWVDDEPILVASTRRSDGPDLAAVDLAALRADRGTVVLGRRDLGWGEDAAPADHIVAALGSGGSGIDGLLVIAQPRATPRCHLRRVRGPARPGDRRRARPHVPPGDRGRHLPPDRRHAPGRDAEAGQRPPHRRRPLPARRGEPGGGGRLVRRDRPRWRTTSARRRRLRGPRPRGRRIDVAAARAPPGRCSSTAEARPRRWPGSTTSRARSTARSAPPSRWP